MNTKFLIFIFIMFYNIHCYGQAIKIKFNSPILSSNTYDFANNTNQKEQGIQTDNYLNISNLKGASTPTSFCQNTFNSSVFSTYNILCSVGFSNDIIKLSIPFIMDYDIDPSLSLSIGVISQNNPAILDPLLNIKFGNSNVSESYTLISEFSNIFNLNNNIKTIGYGGSNASINANFSFEIPFKGSQFKSERSSIIKIITIIESV